MKLLPVPTTLVNAVSEYQVIFDPEAVKSGTIEPKTKITLILWGRN